MRARSNLAYSGLCGSVPLNRQPSDGALPSCLSPPPPSPPPAPLSFTFACARQDDVCYGLAQLYEATNGAGWYHNDGWSAARAGVTTDYCSFFGAACDGSNALTQLCVSPRRP